MAHCPNALRTICNGGIMWLGDELARAPKAFPPLWAQHYGDDEYGLWAQLALSSEVTMTFRWIEPGWFWMGTADDATISDADEKPRHIVNVTKGFWMAETPCTNSQWGTLEQTSSKADHPKTDVSWEDVQKMIERIQADLPEGVKADLPSEAQWEYACRAGTGTAYWWGVEADEKRMNVNEKYKGTTPVKQFEANPWGLYDVHGNVWEWCADEGKRRYTKDDQNEPLEMGDGVWRVLRGGSWSLRAAYARAASRNHDPRGDHWDDGGFRLVLRSL